MFDSGKQIEEDGIEEAFEVVGELPETVKNGTWVGDCFIFTNSGLSCSLSMSMFACLHPTCRQ